MFCQNCGNEIKKADSTFCSHCGASLLRGTRTPTPDQSIPTPQKEKKSGSKLTKTLKILGIIVLVLIIVGAVMIFIFLGYLGSHAAQTANIQSISIVVSCNGCDPPGTSFIGNSQFTGSIDNNNVQISVSGNNTMTWHESRNGNSLWSMGWSFQKSGVSGTLEVKLIADDGRILFDNSTSSSYGIVSGGWSG